MASYDALYKHIDRLLSSNQANTFNWMTSLFFLASTLTHVLVTQPQVWGKDDTNKYRVEQRTAREQCGNDRRCRLERMKELNRKRRMSAEKGRYARAINFQNKLDKNKLILEPREAKTIGIDLDVMTSNDFVASGFSLTWQWLTHIRLMAAYYSVCEINKYEAPSFNYYDDGRCMKAGLRYFNQTDAFTTYFDIYGLHVRMEGVLSGFDNYNEWIEPYFDPFTEESYNNLGVMTAEGELEAHILGLGVGLDWQHASGLHLRGGVSTHYVLYASHRNPSTRANLETRDLAPVMMNEILAIVFDFSVGYAF